VETGEKGFERVETGSPEAVTTGADGRASITFFTAGWHRIKATAVDAQGAETVVRSNRLDVCVPPPPASECGSPPPEDEVRTPPPPVAGEEEAEPTEEAPPRGGRETPAGQAPASTGSPNEVKKVQVRALRIDRSRIGDGLVGVSWAVLDPGAGIGRWTISSKTTGRKGSGWVGRASGSRRNGATLRLPRGHAYRLRLTVIDGLGRGSRFPIGRVRVPR
jgi:hypothetical protein